MYYVNRDIAGAVACVHASVHVWRACAKGISMPRIHARRSSKHACAFDMHVIMQQRGMIIA